MFVIRYIMTRIGARGDTHYLDGNYLLIDITPGVCHYEMTSQKRAFRIDHE